MAVPLSTVTGVSSVPDLGVEDTEVTKTGSLSSEGTQVRNARIAMQWERLEVAGGQAAGSRGGLPGEGSRGETSK